MTKYLAQRKINKQVKFPDSPLFLSLIILIPEDVQTNIEFYILQG